MFVYRVLELVSLFLITITTLLIPKLQGWFNEDGRIAETIEDCKAREGDVATQILLASGRRNLKKVTYQKVC